MNFVNRNQVNIAIVIVASLFLLLWGWEYSIMLSIIVSALCVIAAASMVLDAVVRGNEPENEAEREFREKIWRPALMETLSFTGTLLLGFILGCVLMFCHMQSSVERAHHIGHARGYRDGVSAGIAVSQDRLQPHGAEGEPNAEQIP